MVRSRLGFTGWGRGLVVIGQSSGIQFVLHAVWDSVFVDIVKHGLNASYVVSGSCELHG